MDVFKTLILDTPTVEGATGTVTSVNLTAGTGISVSGGPITSSGSITVTNTAPSLGGDVVGPASATDNAVVRFDSTTGKLIQDSGVSISDANLLTTTALTVNDNTILGSSNSDTVNFNARVSSEFTPATDNTYDLGRTGHEWRDLYIDGTANIDSLVADTADVNGGTIDGATIGASTASSGAFTTLSASDDANFDSGTLFVDASADSVGIGTTSPTKELHIKNTGSYSVGDSQLLIEGNVGGYGAGISFQSPLTGGPLAEMARITADGENTWDTTAANQDAGLRFYTALDGTVAERLRIDRNGNVGIGTTSPSSKLAVGGNPPTAGAIAGVGSSGGISLALSDNVNNSLYVKHVASSAATIGTDAGGQLAFATNGFTEAVRIDSSGNVGIGTTSPSQKLSVNGTIETLNGNVVSPVGTALRLAAGSNTSVTLGVDGGNQLVVSGYSGTSIANGLAVTGDNGFIANTGASANSKYIDISNTAGLAQVGVYATGQAFLYGSQDTWIYADGAVVGTFSSTGLAVTGALSATGSVSSGVGLTGASGRHVVDMLQGGYSVPGDYNTAANGDKFIAYLGDSYDARIGVGTSADMWFKSAGNAAASFGFYTGATTLTKRVDISSTGLDVTGAITATGNITAYYSDDRLKTKLGNIENALDKVSKLNGFYYEANETAQALGYKSVREVGLSAQQVEAVLPEVVAPAPIDNEYKTLHYERVIPLLVEAIKELKAEIELLKK